MAQLLTFALICVCLWAGLVVVQDLPFWAAAWLWLPAALTFHTIAVSIAILIERIRRS